MTQRGDWRLARQREEDMMTESMLLALRLDGMLGARLSVRPSVRV